ncbi:hypothetical protein [Microvirga zambiensis]|uniref:hypothetical protein n=1 Tax=Microvirga zambiensis TaxID=1402137 RepID=UPI00191EDCD9|nr:hypothetical protein [Microvirga zambiensis]
MILWLSEENEPPDFPLTVGFWTANPATGADRWQIFGRDDNLRFVSDGEIHGWKALLRG